MLVVGRCQDIAEIFPLPPSPHPVPRPHENAVIAPATVHSLELNCWQLMNLVLYKSCSQWRIQDLTFGVSVLNTSR